MKVPTTIVTLTAATLACAVALTGTPTRADAATKNRPAASSVTIELSLTQVAIPAWLPMPMWWSG